MHPYNTPECSFWCTYITWPSSQTQRARSKIRLKSKRKISTISSWVALLLSSSLLLRTKWKSRFWPCLHFNSCYLSKNFNFEGIHRQTHYSQYEYNMMEKREKMHRHTYTFASCISSYCDFSIVFFWDLILFEPNLWCVCTTLMFIIQKKLKLSSETRAFSKLLEILCVCV